MLARSGLRFLDAWSSIQNAASLPVMCPLSNTLAELSPPLHTSLPPSIFFNQGLEGEGGAVEASRRTDMDTSHQSAA